jgi:hypothetical protein
MNPDTTIASKAKRAALYVRVSTTNRSTRNQAVFEQTRKSRSYLCAR